MSTVIRGAALAAMKSATRAPAIAGEVDRDHARAVRVLEKMRHGEQLVGITRAEAKGILDLARAADVAKIKLGPAAERFLETLEIVEGDE